MSHDQSCTHCPGTHTGERPCLASATTKARSWMLLEHPGPWAEKIEHMNLPIVAEAIRRGVRPQLIRRTGRRHATPPMQVYVGWSGQDAVSHPPGYAPPPPWMEGQVVTDPADLAALDLSKVARGERPGFGTLIEEPMFLVCTHAKRNVCCARTGGPLARRLAKRYGDLIWETSHVGGDRFAANLVAMPHALYYGQLDASSAEAAVDAYLRGEVVLDKLRGRAGQPEAAQAAEHFVREHTGLRGVDEVQVISLTGSGPYLVTVRAGENTWSGTVEQVEATSTCGPECDENVQTYQIRDLALHSEAALV